MPALSLEYHDVVAGEDSDSSGFSGLAPASYKLTLKRFEEHLDEIERQGGSAATSAIDWLAQGAAGKRPLFFTFDDGGVGGYTCIADALERRGWRGHFFVTCGRIGTRGFLVPAQIRDLHRRGHVIGSHSFSHPTRMGACPPERILEEWNRSCGILADILGEPVVIGSVPGGYYKLRVAQASARAGLKMLFTSLPSTRTALIDGCLVLGRYTIRRWSSAQYAAAIAIGHRAPRICQWGLYRGMQIVRTVGGQRYIALRDRLWQRTSLCFVMGFMM